MKNLNQFLTQVFASKMSIIKGLTGRNGEYFGSFYAFDDCRFKAKCYFCNGGARNSNSSAYSEKNHFKSQNEVVPGTFTSHSPYVIEEFDPSEVIVLQNKYGKVSSSTASFPPAIKRKNYKEQFRKKYCEALLSKRVLITEGRTEYDSIPVAARRLHAFDPQKYSSLEAMGVAVIDAETDSQIIAIASHLKSMGKIVYAVYDKQEVDQSTKIKEAVDHPFESSEASFEKLVLNKIPSARLKTFAISIVTNEDWPDHLSSHAPNENTSEPNIKEALAKYFNWSKGAGSAANLIESCELDEIPEFIRTMLESIKNTVEIKPEADVISQIDPTADQGVNDGDSAL